MTAPVPAVPTTARPALTQFTPPTVPDLTPESLAAACRAGRAVVIAFPSGTVLLATAWGRFPITLHLPDPTAAQPTPAPETTRAE